MKRSEIPGISEAEWRVMKILWRTPGLTATEIVDALNEKRWNPKTVHTLLRRLVEKGAVQINRKARPHLFSPKAPEEACILAESRSFLDRVFDGRLSPLVACFLEREKLEPSDIQELKRLLEEK